MYYTLSISKKVRIVFGKSKILIHCYLIYSLYSIIISLYKKLHTETIYLRSKQNQIKMNQEYKMMKPSHLRFYFRNIFQTLSRR